jgi:hypothetical protein
MSDSAGTDSCDIHLVRYNLEQTSSGRKYQARLLLLQRHFTRLGNESMQCNGVLFRGTYLDILHLWTLSKSFEAF